MYVAYSSVKSHQNDIFILYELPLKQAIVLIGDPGWIVCRELFDDVWKDVPVVVTNARDRLPASVEILLSHAPLTEANSVPAKEWRRGYNITTLKQHYYIKETIELICQLIPDMKRLAFISDDRYISEETRCDMKEVVTKYFPDLPLELLSTTQLSTEALLDTLHSYKSNTGIIYYSWFESHNKDDNNYLFDHIQDVISNFTPSPLFLLSSEDLSNNTFAGGYYVSAESFGQSLLEILYRKLLVERRMPICAIRYWRNIIYLLIVIRKQLFISISPKVSFSNIKSKSLSA